LKRKNYGEKADRAKIRFFPVSEKGGLNNSLFTASSRGHKKHEVSIVAKGSRARGGSFFQRPSVWSKGGLEGGACPSEREKIKSKGAIVISSKLLIAP